MSTFWIHRDGTVAVDDAVLKGINISSLPSNVQLVLWYEASGTGEIRYADEDRLPIREPVFDLEQFVPIFDEWILAAKTPLPTTSGKTMPAITLAQAKGVKNSLVQGIYTTKLRSGLDPGYAASLRDAHVANVNAQSTVDGVAAYDITSGW